MALNQNARYNASDYFDVRYNNIVTEGDNVEILGSLIIDDVEPGNFPDILCVDGTNKIFRTTSAGGGDVSSTSNDSVVDQLVVWSDTSGKVIKKTNNTSPTVEKLDVSHPYGSLMYRGDGTYMSKKSFGFNQPFTDPQFVIPSHAISTSTFGTDTSAIFSINIGCFLNGVQTVISNLTQSTIYSTYFRDGELMLVKRDNCVPSTQYDVNTAMNKIWSISPNVNNIRFGTEIVANAGLVSNVQNNFDNSTTTFLNSTVDFGTATVNNFPPQYNQSLNTNDTVGFNTITCGNLKVLQLEVNEIDSFVGTQIEIKSTNLRIESDNFTVLPTTNVNFDSALTIDLTNSVVDFTNSTVTGLPAGGDVSGPNSAIDNAIATFNGTSGKEIQTSNVQIVGSVMNLNGNINGSIATFNVTNTGALASNSALPILLNSTIIAGSASLTPAGILQNSGSNNFQSSTTNFTNATLNLTNSIFSGLLNTTENDYLVVNGSGVLSKRTLNTSNFVSHVGAVPNTGNLTYYNGDGSFDVTNSNITTDGINNLANVNAISAVKVNTDEINGTTLIKTGLSSQSNPNGIEIVNDVINYPFGIWAPSANNDSFMGFDVTTGGGSNNYRPNSDNQVLFNKTATGLAVFGGNNLKSNGNFQLTSMQNLLEFQENSTEFNSVAVFNSNVNLPSLGENATNDVYLTQNGSTIQKKTILPIYGGIYFTNNLTTTPLPILNQFTLFGSLFTLLPDSSGITTPTQAITITNSGVLDLNASISLESQSSSFTQYEFCLFKNGIAVDGSCRKSSTTDSNEDKNVECSSIISVVTNDVIDIRVRNVTNSNAILITNCCLKVNRVFT